ncbi:MAG: calcium-binding protein [Solirubrobacterales bacterium]
MKHRILFATACAAGAAAYLPAVSPASAAPPLCGGEPATYVGTSGVDRIKTTSPDLGDRPVLVMRGGDDRVSIDAADRKTLICLGPGADQVKLRHTTERRSTRRDSLIIYGAPGDDRVRARVAKTHIKVFGDSGADLVEGGNAGDHIEGGGGDDRIFSTRGDDLAIGDGGDDIIVGGDGNDLLKGDRGDDFLDGDIPNGRRGADRGFGGKGRDRCDEIEIPLSCERV